MKNLEAGSRTSRRRRRRAVYSGAACWPLLTLALLMLVALVSRARCQPTDKGVANAKTLDVSETVKQVCANKKVPIQSVKRMLEVIGAVQLDDRKCRERYLSAIYELQPILQLPSENLCDDYAFDMLKDYHFRFIQPMKQANRRPTQFEAMPKDLVKGQLHPEPRKYTVDFDEHEQVLLAPLSFRHFFLKFALQVSYQCKRNLLSNLRHDAQKLLGEKDREVMALFQKDSPIGEALSGGLSNIDFDSVLYMPELDGRLVNPDGEIVQPVAAREQHLKTSARENSALFQMIYTCKNRFKPLYDKLIIPVVRLSKLGYDYQGELGFTQLERAYLSGGEMKNWLVLVHVCEIFKNTVLVHADETGQERAEKRAGAARRTLRDELNDAVRDEDDEGVAAAAAAATTAEGRNKDGNLVPMSDAEAKQIEMQARLMETFKPIDYEPAIKNSLGDQLMIEREKDLDVELSRKHGYTNPLGFRGFIRRALRSVQRQLAKLDLMKFAHYRRHSLWYSGLLNFISSLSNVASISITVMCLSGITFG